MKALQVIILIHLPCFLFSQTVSNIRHQTEKDQVMIFYDLDSEWPVNVSVHLSSDGGRSFGVEPLKQVTGDIGENVQSGKDRKIVWHASREKVKTSGKLKFFIKTDSRFGSFTDARDGRTYKTVRIGNQTWMAENMNYYAGCRSWCYDDRKENCGQYGRLYKWEDAQKAVPQGWRLPTKEDWEILLNYLGEDNAYHQLIAGGASGFDAQFAGVRLNSGEYFKQGVYTCFWSDSPFKNNSAWYFYLHSSMEKAALHYDLKCEGFSVRCIKE